MSSGISLSLANNSLDTYQWCQQLQINSKNQKGQMYPHVYDLKIFTVYSPCFCLHCPDEFKDDDERVPFEC